jgi:fatty-acyl-CoA synthase
MMIPNTPEFIFTFLGLNKIGVTASFINTSLRRHQLEHALNVSKAKLFLIHPHFEEHVSDVASSIKDAQFYLLADRTSTKTTGLKAVAKDIASYSNSRPSRLLRSNFTPKSTAAYIFTSGTTGHAKASKILNVRLLTAGSAFDIICKFNASDCLCISSPLYHASGSNIGFGLWFLSGCKLVLVEKFSASNFFRQLVENKCTAFVYVGEMCRYLLHAPKSDYDRQHTIRVAIGNGLRGDVWGPFKERYQLPWISEFYSATESPATLLTMVEKQGSMGRIPLLIKKQWNCLLVKYDREKGELCRDPKTGFCMECGPDDVGQILGKMDGSDTNTFHGYTDEKESEKKIGRDIFQKGDRWFLTGDLAKMDREGCFFFVDRVGDTFRWKGQNVSTTEIEEAVSLCAGSHLQEVAVYGALRSPAANLSKIILTPSRFPVFSGVVVPGTEGKAGMASIVLENPKTFDFKAFHNKYASIPFFKAILGSWAHFYPLHRLKDELPSYAVPMLLRIVDKLETTGMLISHSMFSIPRRDYRKLSLAGTHKYMKAKLAGEGFDITKITDPIYFNDISGHNFIPMDQELYNSIASGSIQL